MQGARPPDAAGIRLRWPDVPGWVRAAVEDWLDSRVVSAVSRSGGFSPGVAARLETADGRRVFAKAAGPEPNPVTPQAHSQEARVAAALPAEAPVPRLLWSFEEDGWVVLLFENVEGRNPAVPWRADELGRTLDALADLSELLTPSPLPLGGVVGDAGGWSVISEGHWRKLREERDDRLDGWSARHLDDLAALEAEASDAVGGDTLLHLDVRADNLLLGPEGRVLVVDWPHARVGAAWVDAVFFAPSVAMQGGPRPEDLFDRHPYSGDRADAEALTAVAAAVAGFFTREGLQPAPPGLPTLRAFQAAQGEVARGWLERRTGWR